MITYESKNQTFLLQQDFVTERSVVSISTYYGHGNVMWVMGGKVKGGKIYGQWSGLADNQLHEGRDLPVNTDYREVVSHVLDRHFQLSKKSLNEVFPRFKYQNNISFI